MISDHANNGDANVGPRALPTDATVIPMPFRVPRLALGTELFIKIAQHVKHPDTRQMIAERTTKIKI